MLKKIFGKKVSEENDSLKERISSMNLTDLILYVKGKIKDLEPSEEGIIEVLNRLVSQVNEKRYFLDKSDDDSKLKKAFDLILLCSNSNKITLKAIELIAKFIKQYEPLIKEYDKKHKDIYYERLKKAIEKGMVIIEAKVSLQNKMNLLD